MAKSLLFVCQNCGACSLKWKGKCDDCHQWNSFSSNVPSSSPLGDLSFEALNNTDSLESFPRLHTGLKEFDRVCGGGIVAGSVSLVAGDPGIGKSTLLLQLAGLLAVKTSVVYLSGEESASQIRLRAQRLKLSEAPLQLLSTSQLDLVFPLLPPILRTSSFPGFMIIDSIQTMVMKEGPSAAGSLTQIRLCMHSLIHMAKSTGMAVMIVGHVTKDGLIAGPKVLEHMVDTVLYFEGESNRPYRLLRTVKNRFGSSHEVGVFDMTQEGLKEITNPSSFFLSARPHPVSGACTFAAMEGSRPLLVEFQALSTPSFLASPRRSIVGWDSARLSMILAVLEARCQLAFSKKDVFLTVLGGIKITEPAADLCVAIALLSCLRKKPLPQGSLAFGEIGLTGEIYAPSFVDQRLREAKQLGFSHVFMPPFVPCSPELKTMFISHVKDLDLCFSS